MPRVAHPSPFLDDDTAAFMQGGVSIIAGSRSAGAAGTAPQATLMRALGCRVAPDRSEVTVLLNGPQSRELLDDVRATGHIAVVFTQPSTHRAIQLKAVDARVVDTTPLDWALASHYQQTLARELESLGFPKDLAMAILTWRPAELAAVTFSPTEGYDQTPGPRAGSPLELRA